MASHITPMNRFLYAILKQVNLRDIKWNEVAQDPVLSKAITNGHAARMRFSRFRAAITDMADSSSLGEATSPSPFCTLGNTGITKSRKSGGKRRGRKYSEEEYYQMEEEFNSPDAFDQADEDYVHPSYLTTPASAPSANHFTMAPTYHPSTATEDTSPPPSNHARDTYISPRHTPPQPLSQQTPSHIHQNQWQLHQALQQHQLQGQHESLQAQRHLSAHPRQHHHRHLHNHHQQNNMMFTPLVTKSSPYADLPSDFSADGSPDGPGGEDLFTFSPLDASSASSAHPPSFPAAYGASSDFQSLFQHETTSVENLFPHHHQHQHHQHHDMAALSAPPIVGSNGYMSVHGPVAATMASASVPSLTAAPASGSVGPYGSANPYGHDPSVQYLDFNGQVFATVDETVHSPGQTLVKAEPA